MDACSVVFIVFETGEAQSTSNIADLVAEMFQVRNAHLIVATPRLRALVKYGACLLPPLTAWPTRREHGVSLRHISSGIYRLERIQRVSWCTLRKAQIFEFVDQWDFALLCQTTDVQVPGVFLTCVRSPKDESVICRCGDKADTMAPFGTVVFVSKDSFLVKAE